jgi:hypothetical protein
MASTLMKLPKFVVFIMLIIFCFICIFISLLFSSLLKVSEIVQASSSAQTNDKEDQEVDVDNDEPEDDGGVFPNSSLLGRNDTKDGKEDFLVLVQTFNQ